jgi:hypothetical protein
VDALTWLGGPEPHPNWIVVPGGPGDPGILGPDDRLRLDISSPVSVRAVVVDTLGRVVAQTTLRSSDHGEEVHGTLHFRPSGDWRYVAPIPGATPFSAISYGVLLFTAEESTATLHVKLDQIRQSDAR